ncbi:FAD/NAD(P)-binding domain-containing protein [Xylariaceae sp. AK1471]|nr:FAD/NAD(P)-binding domain-containing protein [Xylariaceae sp. AK1471]
MAPQPEEYDLICVGSGEASKLVSWAMSANHGQKTIVVERQWMGGSCPNIACLPSKSFVHSAAVIHESRRAAAYGLDVTDKAADLQADMARIVARKRELLQTVNGFQGLFDKFKVPLVRAEATMVGPKLVQLSDGRLLTANRILICTGSRARIDERIPGLVAAKPMTHIELLDLESLPSHLIILGGGYVGLEFAQAFRRFGSTVTVIQRRDRVLPQEDGDVVEALTATLEKEGIRFLLGAEAKQVSGMSGESVTVTVAIGADTMTLNGSHILVAAGRVPNTDGMGLETAGIKTTPASHIAVDSNLRTSVPGVWAAGDCAGSPYFTHIGWDDHRVVMADMLGSPRPGGTQGRLVPRVLFTDPELASVGLTEKQANAQGIKYRLAKIAMADAFLRVQTLGPEHTTGFAKALVEADGDRILGFTALGSGAGELLPVVTLAIKLGVSYREIVDLIVAHPTLNEGLVMLFDTVPQRE